MGTMRTMTTRLARPALMAAVTLALLLALLAGCRVTVLQVDYAPTELELRERTLILTNDVKSRGTLSIPDVLKYHFNSRGQVLDRNLNPATRWDYDRESYQTATLTMTIPRAGNELERTTCRLTFRSRDRGTHRCAFELSDTVAFLTISASGRAEGAFRIVPLEPN